MMSRHMSKSLGDEVVEDGSFCALEEVAQEGVNPTGMCNCGQLFSAEKPPSVDSRFDEYLVKAIDETLVLLGKSVANAFYSHLENAFEIKKNEIPSKIKEFSTIIHNIFGLGASRLEVRFIQNLQAKLQVKSIEPASGHPLPKCASLNMTFEDYLFVARRNFKKCQC